MAEFTRKALRSQATYVGRIGVIRAFVRLLAQHGFSDEEIAGIRDVFVSRWSKRGDIGESGEQLARTMENFADDPRVQAVIAMGQAVFDTAAGRAENRVIPVTVGDVYDLLDVAEGERVPAASEAIGYLLIRGDIAVLRVAYSGSVGGAIHDRRGEPTNLYTETLVQLLKVIRHHQERVGLAWRATGLSMRFSSDFTRVGRFALETSRMFAWFSRLQVDWWLGGDLQPRDKFAEVINALRAHDAESKGRDSTMRTNEGIVDHLAHPDRAPMAENAMPVWRRHVVDPNSDGPDPRARSTGSNRAKGSLLAEWDPAVVPAVRAWLRAEAAGASYNELAAIGAAYRIPTTRQGRRVGSRRATMDQLSWPAVRRRAANLLYLNGEPRRLEQVDPDDPKRAVAERANQRRTAYLDAARIGVERATYSVPRTAGNSLETFGQRRARVVRDQEADPGYVIIPRVIGFPPAYTTRTEMRTVRVPLGTFVQPSPVLDLQETSVTATEAEVTLAVEVIDQPILDEDGNPVPWIALGIDDETYERILDRLRDPSNDGGRSNDAGQIANVLPNLPDHDLLEDGTAMRLRTRAVGPWHARGREVWMRPADREGAWQLNERRAVETAGTRRYLIDGEDVTSWRRAHMSERALLASVADSLTQQADAAFDGDVELVLPVPVGDGSTAIDVQRRQLDNRRAAATAAIDQLRTDADALELLAARKLAQGDEAGADTAADRASTLRKDAAANQATATEIDQQLAALEDEADQAREAVLDERWLSHFAALLHKLARSDRDTPGAVTGEMLAVRHIAARVFDRWRFTPPTDGYVHWSCVALLDTVDGQHVELDMAGKVKDTADGRGWGGREDDELLARILDGTAIDTAILGLHRVTSRASVVTGRLYPALARLGVPSHKKSALLDHPHPVATRAFHAARTGIRPDVIDWTPAFEQLIEQAFTTGSWSRSACPTDLTHEMVVAACLAQHPDTGVEIAELVAKTGIPLDRVRQMVNPPVGSDEHIRRPAFFRWLSEGILGLHPCPHSDCAAETAWASIVVLLPETNPQPGATGGVLCSECLRIPVAAMADVRFPEAYRTLVTRRASRRGSIRQQQLTVAATLPAIPTVNGPAGITAPQLMRETGLPRSVVQRILTDAGITPQRRRRSGHKVAAVYDTQTARRALDAADIDHHAYGPRALAIGEAARHANVTRAELEAATESGELPVHLDGNHRRRWQTHDLDTWLRHRKPASQRDPGW